MTNLFNFRLCFYIIERKRKEKPKGARVVVAHSSSSGGRQARQARTALTLCKHSITSTTRILPFPFSFALSPLEALKFQALAAKFPHVYRIRILQRKHKSKKIGALSRSGCSLESSNSACSAPYLRTSLTKLELRLN